VFTIPETTYQRIFSSNKRIKRSWLEINSCIGCARKAAAIKDAFKKIKSDALRKLKSDF
jgi:hypothetical protein